MGEVGRSKIMLSVVTIVILAIDGVAGRSMSLTGIKIKKLLNKLNKPAVKTIMTENGDIIDCVDIYKQPAFDHPLLKNHTIQMRPSDHREEDNMKPYWTVLAQEWQKKGSCPEATIPIRRTQKSDLLRAPSLERYGMKTVSTTVEAALLSMEGTFYGITGSLNIWNMHVEPQESSASSIIVTRNSTKGDTLITAGWLVSNRVYGDYKTHFSIYWTVDDGETTGCYDVKCPGFVQTNTQIPLGAYFSTVSTYGGTQFDLDVTIYLDRKFNNWWLKYGDVPIGYWPASVLKGMTAATVLKWGGEVGNTGSGGRHTITQMGNGHYPSEGVRKSAYVRNIRYMGGDGQYHNPDGAIFWTDKPYCYDMESYGMDVDDVPGYFFLYGGSGQGENCV